MRPLNRPRSLSLNSVRSCLSTKSFGNDERLGAQQAFRHCRTNSILQKTASGSESVSEYCAVLPKLSETRDFVAKLEDSLRDHARSENGH